jgi:lipoyl(octanoyl) transferase
MNGIMPITVVDWGLIPYAEAYQRQSALFETALHRKATHQPVANCLILCEHPHVITLGRNGLLANLLLPPSALEAKQVELYPVDRGGDITYHGPGQLVGYPILDLDTFRLGLKAYIHQLEEVIIQTIAPYGLSGSRIAGATGVWLTTGPTRKIAAIGVRSSRYITMHGFALNVNTDLSYFGLINPCGFTDKGVTSIEHERGHSVSTDEVKRTLIAHFDRLFPAE